MNNNDHDIPTGGQLEIAMKAMQAIDVPAVPVALIQRTRPAMLQACRRRGFRIRVSQIATVAIISLVLVGLFFVLTQANSSQALVQVAERVGATKTLRAVIVDPLNGGTLLVSGTHVRVDSKGSVDISDSATRQEVMLEADSKSAYRIPQRGASRALDFYGIFRELAATVSVPIEDYVDKAGRHFPGFKGQAPLKISNDATWKVDAKVWSDPTSKLPVRLEIRPTDVRKDFAVIVIEQIEFDVPLDDALFDMSIPAGYKVMGLAADQLKPLPNCGGSGETDDYAWRWHWRSEVRHVTRADRRHPR